jgi:arabinofuranosyltransferase
LSVIALLLLSAVLLYAMWRLFWFLTDDAFISFRYVSNSHLGYGYVWNPPPFLPVEGYSNFLWVALLDVVWRLLGVEPPISANWLSLLFSFGTIIVTAAIAMRMDWNSRLCRYRTILLGICLLGILTNRTFLTWSSSGLETAMFNFFLTFWVYSCCIAEPESAWWPLQVALSSSALALTRPDGLVFWTVGVCCLCVDSLRYRRGVSVGRVLSAMPALLVPIHLLWRGRFYGEWLPNTYYAKITAVWPESGMRYFLSFVLEYAVWMWFGLLALVLARRLRDILRRQPFGFPNLLRVLFRQAQDPGVRARFPRLASIVALALHFLFFTYIAGGDHFEFRVYSHVIPLLFLSFLWLLNREGFGFASTATTFSLFILLSLPVPWLHWSITHDLRSRAETFRLKAPVAPHLPSPLAWYGRWFDGLQSWLIDRSVCMRHQEHKVLYETQRALFPSRAEGLQIPADGYPVLATSAVGVASWTLPRVNVIDLAGLNDYVIARTPVDLSRAVDPNNPLGLRQMAHERRPPEGYVDSFSPNVAFLDRRWAILRRPTPLTAERIRAEEHRWRAKIASSRLAP